MQRLFSWLNIISSLLVAACIVKSLILNGATMSVTIIIVAILSIILLVGNCFLSPGKANFVPKTFLLIIAMIALWFGMTKLLPQSSLTLSSVTFYQYAIYCSILVEAIALIGCFVPALNNTETSNNNVPGPTAKQKRPRKRKSSRKQRKRDKQMQQQSQQLPSSNSNMNQELHNLVNNNQNTSSQTANNVNQSSSSDGEDIL